ncbi:MAG: tetratricopeptide repeat protein, partial [Promethearchaeota archaeon]
MPRPESKELIRAKELIDEGKFDKFLQIKVFENKGEHTLYDIVSYRLLKCELLFQQGQYENVVNYAELAYKESIELGKNILSVDALLIKAHALNLLYKSGDTFDMLRQGEKLLENLPEELTPMNKQRKAYLIYIKAQFYYWVKNEVDRALEHSEHSLIMRERFGAKQEISQSLTQIAWILGHGKGDLDQALKYAQRGLAFAEESKKKYQIAWSLNTLGMIYNFRGDLDRSIILFEQSMAIFKELNNKDRRAWVFNNLGDIYRMKGEFDRALECSKQSLKLFSEAGNLITIANAHDFLIQILVEKGDSEQAHQYLHDLEQLNDKLKDKQINFTYLFDKAYILKTSSRTRDRGKAEEILKQLLKEDDLKYEDYIRILLILCELLLIELQMTNEIEVLSEIEPLISRLKDFADKSQSFWILGEIYLFQAKLALISLDLKKTRQLLTQGQQIAEKHGLDSLARKISYEHDNLFEEMGKWEHFKRTQASFEERMKLSRLNEQLDNILKKRPIKHTEIYDEESVVILIMSQGGIPIFLQMFTKELSFQDHLFGNFLIAINSFSDEMLSEGFDRATFGKYTLIMKPVSPFLVCYLFKGQSYSAQQRIMYFIDKIQNNKDIWQTFKDYHDLNR